MDGSMSDTERNLLKELIKSLVKVFPAGNLLLLTSLSSGV